MEVNGAVPELVSGELVPNFQTVAAFRLCLRNDRVMLRKKTSIPETKSVVLLLGRSRCQWQDSFWKLLANRANPAIRYFVLLGQFVLNRCDRQCLYRTEYSNLQLSAFSNSIFRCFPQIFTDGYKYVFMVILDCGISQASTDILITQLK